MELWLNMLISRNGYGIAVELRYGQVSSGVCNEGNRSIIVPMVCYVGKVGVRQERV